MSAQKPTSYVTLVPRVAGYLDVSPAREHLDMRLLHHFTVKTGPCIASILLPNNQRALDLLQSDIPALAFEHRFLLDVVLFAAAVHMGSEGGYSSPLGATEVAAYRDAALRGQRRAVAAVMSTPRTGRAVKAASLLLGTVSFASDRVLRVHGGEQHLWAANWLALGAGARLFLGSPAAFVPIRLLGGGGSARADSPAGRTQRRQPRDDDGPLLPDAVAPMPDALTSLLGISEDDPDWEYREDLAEAAGSVANIIASLSPSFEKMHPEFTVFTLIWSFNLGSSRFSHLVQKGNARALIIFAYYLVLMKLLPRIWLFEGVVDHDMEIIEAKLAPEWRDFFETPRSALKFSDKESVTRVLLRGKPSQTAKADRRDDLPESSCLEPIGHGDKS